MSSSRVSASALFLAALLVFLSPAPLASPADQRLRHADLAWDRGDYPAALRAYLAFLDSPDADQLRAPVALQTGELFRTTELTADGGTPGFSPDGRYLSYEIGRGATRRTRIALVDTPLEVSAELPGYGASFSPDTPTVAYLSTAGPRRGAASTVVVRNLVDGTERRVETGSVVATSLLAAAEGVVLFGGADAEDLEQVHGAVPGQPARALTSGAPHKVLHAIDAAGTAAVFTYRTSAIDGRAFGIVMVPAMTVTRVTGSAPAISADGRRVTFVRQTGGLHQLMTRETTAPTEVVVRAGVEPIDAPAFSPDGSRIAFQLRLRDDWELYVIGMDGRGLQRITREVQHDVSPRFLTSERVMGLVGEPRHRRSFVYDLSAGTRTRLFHNNTVRTIAPEYHWAASPDGSRLLIVADRDGDTISPARGVYLVDLTSTVTLDALRERLTLALASEEALRARGRRLFAPIAGAVRRVVAEASAGQIFQYQHALFAFDSKHISRPGNRQAAQYLFEAYASFGYEPEYQWFDSEAALGRQTANVLATLPGTLHPEIVYVVSSHYDSVVESPGADDNSSGTAALLETARLLAAHPQPATIIFASFTGEESGLLGSREFVRQAVARSLHVAGALNNDMIGWTNDHRLDNTIRYGSPGIRDIQHAGALQFTDLITYDARYFRGTDAHAFFEAYGEIFGGIGSYPVLGNPRYHEPNDVLDTINHQLVTEVAKTTAASVMLLASSPAPVTGVRTQRTAGGVVRLSWAPSRERDVTGYLLEWGASGGPERERRHVTDPTAEISAPAGTVVEITAVNRQGLEGWDSTRVTLD